MLTNPQTRETTTQTPQEPRSLVIKAFIANDFVFFDKAGDTIDLVDSACLELLHKVRITWRIQKNW